MHIPRHPWSDILTIYKTTYLSNWMWYVGVNDFTRVIWKVILPHMIKTVIITKITIVIIITMIIVILIMTLIIVKMITIILIMLIIMVIIRTTSYIWLYVLVMSRTRFRVNPHSQVAWMSRNSLLKAGAKPEA